MTLHEMLSRAPECFYTQTWYYGEEFLQREPRADLTWPERVDPFLQEAPPAYSAADLASLYLMDPGDPMWKRYLWTSDFDRHGQRVYVGNNGLGLEIHRHLAITERWGVPI